jgi:hypothetical protein
MAEAADFFVSYTNADRAWAEWIAWQLEAEGYRVVVQAWDFRPGTDFVEQMHQVVEQVERTIAVLSLAYLDSAFGGAEWRAVFAKDPTGEHGLLLPVRVEEVEPPGLLRTRIYVDSSGRTQTTRGLRCSLPSETPVANPPRSRSSLPTSGGQALAPARRLGSRASSLRSGTCPSSPIPSLLAAT